MTRYTKLIFYAIPGIVAIIILYPLLLKTEIPYTAVVPSDVIEFEYITHDIQIVSFGVVDKTIINKTEILTIQDTGQIKYTIIKENSQDEIIGMLNNSMVKNLTALIKETGFIQIPSDSFLIKDNITNYKKSVLKITLNQNQIRIIWPQQNATDTFIPPIITIVESEMQGIISDLKRSN